MTNASIRRAREESTEDIRRRIQGGREDEVRNEIIQEARCVQELLHCSKRGPKRVHVVGEEYSDGTADCVICGEKLGKGVVDLFYKRKAYRADAFFFR